MRFRRMFTLSPWRASAFSQPRPKADIGSLPSRWRLPSSLPGASCLSRAHGAAQMGKSVSGTEPGQRQLNGPQTSGRDYLNLSTPQYEMTREDDVAVPMRDGVQLLADVFRPTAPGRYPVLIAASPYPRQIQDLGAPMGFIEAGASDFFVPRGYVHVIANIRGSGGSGGTFGFFDGQERRDMHDLVGWQRRHGRDKLFCHDSDGGSRRAAAALGNHHADSGHIRFVRLGRAPWP